MSLNELRVRLEGRLEVLEAAASLLEALDAQLRGGTWADAIDHTPRHLREWAELAPRVGDAIAAARRANAEAPLARLATIRAQLSRSILEHLAHTGVARLGTLEERLAAWLRLVEATGLPPRQDRLLGEASARVRSRAWVAFLVLSALMLPVGQQFPSGALLLIAGAAFMRLQRTFRYRLFPDALVVEQNGEPPVDVPLLSLERGEVRPGMTLRGLVDIQLPDTEQLRPFCVLINRVLAERQVLIEEQQALAKLTGPAGRWVSGTWSPASGEEPARVEVLKFEKDETVQLVEGTEQAPDRGVVLVMEPGLLFIPRRAESKVREVLFKTGWIDLLTEERVPLSHVPERTFLERLVELRAVPGVIWVAGTVQVPGMITLPEGALSLGEPLAPTTGPA